MASNTTTMSENSGIPRAKVVGIELTNGQKATVGEKFTVIVGPNNVGKTRLLQELGPSRHNAKKLVSAHLIGHVDLDFDDFWELVVVNPRRRCAGAWSRTS